MDLIKIAEEAFATGKQHPSFKAGDTITVAYRIVEGSKERVQLYRGVVIKISGHGEKKRFTVRKMSGTVGVERIFPLESPAIDSIYHNKAVRHARQAQATCVLLLVRKPESRKCVNLVILESNIPYAQNHFYRYVFRCFLPLFTKTVNFSLYSD